MKGNEFQQIIDQRRRARELFRQALAVITDPVARLVLDLHAENPVWGDSRCAGCDFDGYESEEPIWPCRTVMTIATYCGIEASWP